jgi:FMN phosphatase YigB (HAD superfamily)
MVDTAIVWDLNGVLFKNRIFDFNTYNIVKSLFEHGYTQYVCTNTRPTILRKWRKKLNKDQYFKEIYGTAQLGSYKPHPKVFQFLKESIPFEKILLIDDSKRNVRIAKSFGIEGIYYESDAQLKKDLKLFDIYHDKEGGSPTAIR